MNFYILAKISPTAELDTSQTAGVIISGLAIVFLVLLLLVGFVNLFGSFFRKNKKNSPEKQSPPTETKIIKQSPSPAPVSVPDTSNDDEIIAVISAVVAQMSIQDGKQYKIKSVKKAKNSKTAGRPVWASEGIRQNTNPF